MKVVNSYYLSRASGKRGSLRNKLRRLRASGSSACPSPRPRRSSRAAPGSVAGASPTTSSWPTTACGGASLSSELPLDDFDLVICEHPPGRRHADGRDVSDDVLRLPGPLRRRALRRGEADRGAAPEAPRRGVRASSRASGPASPSRWECCRMPATRSRSRWDQRAQPEGGSTGAAEPAADRARFSSPPRVIYLGSAFVPVHQSAAALAAEQALSAHRRLRGAAARPGPRPELPRLGGADDPAGVPIRAHHHEQGRAPPRPGQAPGLHRAAVCRPPGGQRHLDLLRRWDPLHEETFSPLVNSAARARQPDVGAGTRQLRQRPASTGRGQLVPWRRCSREFKERPRAMEARDVEPDEPARRGASLGGAGSLEHGAGPPEARRWWGDGPVLSVLSPQERGHAVGSAGNFIINLVAGDYRGLWFTQPGGSPRCSPSPTQR